MRALATSPDCALLFVGGSFESFAGHLREHVATAQPIRVTYLAGGDTFVAMRLEDAPP